MCACCMRVCAMLCVCVRVGREKEEGSEREVWRGRYGERKVGTELEREGEEVSEREGGR